MKDYYRAMGFAECAHIKQKRKYTGDPYVTHCRNVSELIQDTLGKDDAAAVAALLHDIVEDTEITLADIEVHFGKEVAALVNEVTDASKPTDGNRAKRKQIDREHLAKSSNRGASIKLADMIDNTSSIAKYDRDFAKVYLKEKALLLPVLKHGNSELWTLANNTLAEAAKLITQ